MCFLAATTFWLLNALNKNYTTRISYPIQFEYDDSTYIAITPPPKRVALNVSGYGWNLLRKSFQVGSNPLIYRLNNPTQIRYIAGNRLLQNIDEQLQDIRVNYVIDDTLSFEIDLRGSKTVDLRIDSTQVHLATNHRIVSPVRLQPDSIVYYGPVSLLKALPDEIYLEVPARNIADDFSSDIVVNYVQSSLIQANHSKVRVNFDVAEYVQEIKRTPVRLLNLSHRRDSFYLAENQIDISYWIRREDVGRARPEDFRVVADFETFNTTDSTVNVSVELKPVFVNNVTLSKPSVRITHAE